ncbi:SusC/RagA family TonB-linked outer membrane protein [Flavobacterium capsici]|uniref:TonB-dependent receptor n=1 Tax=Flavobacterium capsici TaxID=3075618 RepID=A0AA96F5E8_9FLAO|nr:MULTISPECIES: TonB-dependent receptor [unclassified Flavobacterium]WNM17747.1 TonB-dependent receptor [Flavobacterium sp. PMR2A8]WNM21800.1 TonB-dependent receptor [Flavobacterium sp. PMTSA4]
MSIKCLYNKGAKFNFAITILLVLFMSSKSMAQNGTSVSGVVLDSNGMSLPGVNVVEVGSKNSASTDLDGKFKINVAGQKSVLEFSYIGYTTQSVTVGKQTNISIILKDATSKLDEVVVIGYGTARKSDLTGSITSISGEDLKKLSMPSVAEALTGRLAGVQVTSTEGSPDADIKIRVRGGGSLTQDSSPLIIVDGFPVGSMSDISPSDIASITVLKDASSTAIYGSRGANGVIIITTKSGNDGKISVSYNNFIGFKKLANSIDVLPVQDFVKWQYEYALLYNDQPSFDDVFGTWDNVSQYNGAKGTNWQKEIYGKTGTVQNHDLGIRGGSDKLSYSFNYTRYNEKTIMVGSDFKRDNISFNLKNKASDKVDLAFTARYSDTEINGSGANEQNEISSADARLRHSVGYSPIPLPGITTDDTDEALSSYLINPFVAVDDNQRLQKRKNLNMLGSFSWKLAKNLKLKSDFGFDNYSYLDYRFYGRSTYYVRNIPSAENQGLPSLVINDRKDSRFRNANTLNYDFKNIVSENHNLTLLLGEEMLNFKRETETSAIHGYPKLFDISDAINLSSLGLPQYINNFKDPEDKLLSFFGRAHYDYKNRYLLDATFRADGSSKFLGDNKWGYFPSAAAAWKISKEDFLKDVKWLSELKLRASYGQAGNNNIPTGQTIQTFQSSNSAWINNVDSYLAATKIMANPDLKWETTITQNIGLDFDLFKGKFTGTFELYKNLTNDLLVRFLTPGTGYDYQYRNMGQIQNTGLEASANLVVLDKENYGLSLSFNIGMNRNRINSLGLMNDFGESTNWASSAIGNDFLVNVGGTIGQMYGYVSDGRYEVSDFDFNNGIYTLKSGVVSNSTVIGNVVPGSMKLKDINGDDIVDINDRKVIGNANPASTGGFVINANAYGFDLSAAFNWSYGNDVYNANKIEFNTAVSNNGTGQYRNLTTDMADGVRWTNLNPTTGLIVTDPTELTALNANTSMWSPYMQRYVFSDWAIEDGSFLRLNTLTLGYSLPKSVISKIGISKLRFYGTANNVFIITNYSGLDPEVSTRRNTPLTPGVDYSPYPRSRQFVFGLNLSF